MKTILKVKNINKSFNGLKVLEDVSFSLTERSITSLFGENGSGKSTLFNIISGFLKPDNGNILLNGNRIEGLSPVEISQFGIGRVWQTPRICRNLSLTDNLLITSKNHPGEKVLNYFVRLRYIKREEKLLKEKCSEILEDLGIIGKIKKTAGELSLGEQKLLSIGMLLMNDSEVLLLDEPFAGVHLPMVEHLSEILLALSRKHKTVFMIEHNRTKASAISDKILLLLKGKLESEERVNVCFN